MELSNTQCKESELGLIPNDWEIKKLCNISELATGSTPPTNDPSNYGDEYFFVSPADLGKEKWVTNTEKKLSKKGFTTSRKFPKYSILFTCIGSTIGKCGMALFELTSNQQINAVSPSDNYSNDFLYYALNFLAPKIKLRAGEQAVPIINKTEFGETLLAIPPTKAEQTAIATALSDVDALIENLEKLIAKKRNIRNAVLKVLLTSETDWIEYSIEEIAGSKTKWSITGGPFGSNLKASDYTNDGIRIIQLQNIGDGKFINDYEVYTSIEKADELISCNIYPNEIILSKMGDPVARACIVPNLQSRYLMCSDGIRLVVNKDKFDNFFIFLNLNSRGFRQNAENASTGSTRKRIGLGELKGLKIPCPAKSIQIEIAGTINDLDSEIELIESRLGKYKMIKQGVMQTLLTGKIRLI